MNLPVRLVSLSAVGLLAVACGDGHERAVPLDQQGSGALAAPHVPTTVLPTVEPPAVPRFRAGDAAEQSLAADVAAAAEGVGLRRVRTSVIELADGDRLVDGAFTDDTGRLGVAYTVDRTGIAPSPDAGFEWSPTGYQLRLGPTTAEARMFDERSGTSVSVSVVVLGGSGRVLTEDEVVHIVDALVDGAL